MHARLPKASPPNNIFTLQIMQWDLIRPASRKKQSPQFGSLDDVDVHRRRRR